MALLVNDPASGLRRSSGSFLSPASNLTWMFWYRWFGLQTVSPEFRTGYALGDYTFSAPYIAMFEANGGIGSEFFDGSNYADSDYPVQLANKWNHFAVTYDATSHVILTYINGEIVNTSQPTLDVTPFTFTVESLGGSDVNSKYNHALAQFRSWQSKLTQAEIRSEMNSAVALHASPFMDTPLLTNGNDVSGNGRNWSSFGVVSFDASPVPGIPTSAIGAAAGTATPAAIVGLNPRAPHLAGTSAVSVTSKAISAAVGSSASASSVAPRAIGTNGFGVGSSAGAGDVEQAVSSPIGSMAFRKRPDAWQMVRTRPFGVDPADAPVLFVGPKPLADRGRFIVPRLKEIGTIERPASDRFGHCPPATLRTLWDDTDRFLRDLLGEDGWKNKLINCESEFDILSYEGRKAGILVGRPRMRGRVTEIQPVLDTKFEVIVTDILGSAKGVLDPNRKIGRFITRNEWPACPPETDGKFIYGMWLGEFNDFGEVDLDGNPLEDGVIPARHCGPSFVATDENPNPGPDPAGRTFDSGKATIIDQAIINQTGQGDITTPTYGAILPVYGDGTYGPVFRVLELDPNQVSIPHAHTMVWMGGPAVAAGAVGFIVLFYTNPAFDPITNPLGDPNVRYKYHDASDFNGELFGNPSGLVWDYQESFTSLSDGAKWGMQIASAPQNVGVNVVGTSGTGIYTYSIVGITAFGETRPAGSVTITNGPDVLSDTNFNRITWTAPADFPDGIVAYRILGRDGTSAYLTTVDGTIFTFDDTGVFAPTGFNKANTGGSTALVDPNVWNWFAVSQLPITRMIIYGSNLAEGEEPKRVQIEDGDPDIMIPDGDGSVTAGGIQQWGFYARGPRVQQHIDNKVTFAVNLCGPNGLNDLLINQAFRMLLVVHNDLVERDGGVGYTGGDFPGPIETFADGTAKFWTSKYEEAQATSAEMMGTELGMIGAIGIGAQITVEEFHARFFTTFCGNYSTTGAGQFYPFIADPSLPADFGQPYRRNMEIKRITDYKIHWNETLNRGKYRYMYDWDKQKFRSNDIPFEDADAVADVGPYEPDNTLECFYGNDLDTQEFVASYNLSLYAYPPEYISWATDLTAIEKYSGDPVQVEHKKETIGTGPQMGTLWGINEDHSRNHEMILTARLYR